MNFVVRESVYNCGRGPYRVDHIDLDMILVIVCWVLLFFAI